MNNYILKDKDTIQYDFLTTVRGLKEQYSELKIV